MPMIRSSLRPPARPWFSAYLSMWILTQIDPWDDDSETPTLNTINQTYGRRFEIQSFRWLDQSEV